MSYPLRYVEVDFAVVFTGLRWPEVAEDARRIPDRQLDVGFLVVLGYFENRLRFLKHVVNGIEGY